MRIPDLLPLLLSCSSALALNSSIVGSAADVSTTTSQGLVLMGGGTDVDNAFKWMIGKSGGGDFVVIRWGSLGSYNDYIYGLGTLNSVETIQFDSRTEASDQTVVQKIRNAEALWMAGGDQANYVNGWKDTPVEEAINYLINEKKVPVGGTSAGCAVMTPIYWGATSGSWPEGATANAALTNPFQSGRSGMGFNDFLDPPYLSNTVCDMHYAQRTRQPRHIAMMAYAYSQGYAPIRGIACNEQTAVCVDADGKAVVYGQAGTSGAFFINQYCGGPEVYQSGQPLTWLGGFRVYKVSGVSQGDHYMDLKDWKRVDNGGTWEYWSVDQGVLAVTSSAPQSCATAAGAISRGRPRDRSISVAALTRGIRIDSPPGSPASDASVCVADLSGRQVYSRTIGAGKSATMPLPATMACGAYILRLSQGGASERAPVRVAF